MCSFCIELPKGHIPGKETRSNFLCKIFVRLENHEEEVKDSEEDVHCVEDSVRANGVLQLIDEDEGSALKEEVEDDGRVEQSLLGEGQQVPPPSDWKV